MVNTDVPPELDGPLEEPLNPSHSRDQPTAVASSA